MRVLVTGAAGRLGSCVCRLLEDQGIEFLAVDKIDDPDASYPIKLVDLLSKEACDELAKRVDAVAHFANYANWNLAEPHVVYGENVTMNMNLLQAAADAGVRRIVFSSTIQVLNGEEPNKRHEEQEIVVPYFPLDSNMPAIPRNPYSLSKYATEQMLEYFSKSTGMTCIAIRYPWLLGDYYLRIGVERGGFERGNCHDGFAYLPVYSGAEAAICALNADIEGYRCFFVASKDNLEQRSVSEIVGEQLSGVELKKPLDELDSLVDTGVVEKELGWERPQSLAESLEKYGHLEDVRP